MKTTHKKLPVIPGSLSLAIITVLASPLAIAADQGFFAGASIGETSADLRFNNAVFTTLPAGVTVTSLTYDDSDTGFKLFGGYQFNQYFAFELGRFDLGDYSFTSTTSPAGTSNGNYAVDGWFLDAVGTLPLTPRLDLLGRAGFNHANTETSFRGTGVVTPSRTSIDNSDSNVKLGVGLQYALTDNLDVRLEAERYHVDEPARNKGDIEMYSVGVVYHFGRAPEPRRETPAPVPVARVAPTPTPTPTPPPPPPAPTRVVFSADSLFDFDQSTVRAAGTRELDEFIANLRGVNYDTITVTGHTDRIGNRAYNLDLSQRRADAVKNYLVTNGIPANRVTARGVNGDNSTIAPNACSNTGGRAALISCLQPDRRVEVEVTGTRQ